MFCQTRRVLLNESNVYVMSSRGELSSRPTSSQVVCHENMSQERGQRRGLGMGKMPWKTFAFPANFFFLYILQQQLPVSVCQDIKIKQNSSPNCFKCHCCTALPTAPSPAPARPLVVVLVPIATAAVAVACFVVTFEPISSVCR